MLSKSHIASGLTTAVAILITTEMKVNLTEYIPGIILGSIMPDIDNSKSWVSQSVPFIDDRLRETKLFKHRGITHGISGITLISLLCYLIPNHFMLGFGIGYVTHCITDYLGTLFKIKVNYDSDKILFRIFWILNLILISMLILKTS